MGLPRVLAAVYADPAADEPRAVYAGWLLAKGDALGESVAAQDFERSSTGFFAKKARGQMERFIIDRALTAPETLKDFRIGGYRYNKSQSTEREWVFTRTHPPLNA